MAKSDRFSGDFLGEAVCMTTGRIIPIKGGVKRTPAQRTPASQRYDAFQQYYRDGDKQPLRDLGLFPPK